MNVLKKLKTWEEHKSLRLAAKILLFLAMIFMLGLPYILRSNSTLSGYEAYHFLGGKEITGKIIFFLSEYYFNIFIWGKILPLIFGVLSFVLFWNILKKLGFDLKTRMLSCSILIFSSGFIYLYTTLNGYFIAVFINMLMFYFLLKDWEIPALFLLFILPFFGLFHFILGVIIFMIHTIYEKGYISSIIVLVASAAVAFFAPINKIFTDGPFISDFGGKFGLCFFVVLLALFGLRVLWNKKYEYWYVYIAIISIAVLAFFDLRMLSYLNFMLVLLAALGLMRINNNDWKSLTIKRFMIFVFICGLLFSGLSYAKLLADDIPNEDILNGIQFLRESTDKDGIIFSHPSREYFIEYTGRNFKYVDGLFEERDMGNATSMINENNINYIWIDDGFKYKVWPDKDQGFDFVLEYTTQKFKKIFINDYVSVWQVV